MSKVHADISALEGVLQDVRRTIDDIESVKYSINRQYQNLGSSWNDRKYYELGDIIESCTKALENISDDLRIAEDYVPKLIKYLKNYYGIKISGSSGAGSVSSSIQASQSRQKQSQHREYITDEDRQVDAVMLDMSRGTGHIVTRERAEEITESIRDYTGSNYSEIRYAYNHPDSSSEFLEAMHNVDEYINHSPSWSGGTIYRGINVSRSTAESILSNSDHIDMLGPSSWSTSEYIAQSFSRFGSGDVQMVFVLSNNSRGASVRHISSNHEEDEVLVPSGVFYAEDSREIITQDGTEYIYVYVHETGRPNNS